MKRTELLELADCLSLPHHDLETVDVMAAADFLRKLAKMQPHGCDYEFDEHGEIIAKYPVYRLDLED